jgi:hypothetical protein
MFSAIPRPIIFFLIPFVLSLSYPLAVWLCMPKETEPRRYIQNNLSISIFLHSSFPIAVAVFSTSITRGAVMPWFQGGWAWVGWGITAITVVIVTVIVFQDFTSRPMAPYVLRRKEAKEAWELEDKLRKDFERSSRDQHTEEKKMYQNLTRLRWGKDLFKRGGPIAFIHIGLTWMGVAFAAAYFWYLAAAVNFQSRGVDQVLKAGSRDRLVVVLILMATFIPLRLHTEWYQSYFHEQHWLRKYPAFWLGVFLAFDLLIFITILIQPGATIQIISAIGAVLLGAIGVIGKLKPDWLLGVGEFVQQMTFIEFCAVYLLFTIVVAEITAASFSIAK